MVHARVEAVVRCRSRSPQRRPRHAGRAAAAAPAADRDEALRGRRGVADSTIRVDVDLLDKLMNLVGELVLARNQIVCSAATREDLEPARAPPSGST